MPENAPMRMPEEESQIEELKKKLFSNSGEELPMQKRVRLHRHNAPVGNTWQEETAEAAVKVSDVTETPKRRSGNGSFFRKILATSFIALVAALVFAWYSFSTGINDISNENIDIRLLGPVSSPSGEVLSLDVNVTNNNSADLELADIVVTYPSGTRSASDKVSTMLGDRIAVGTIRSGQTVRENIKSILFGEENVKKDIQVSLEYRLQGSDNVFVKDRIYPVYIGSAPIAVNVKTVKEVIPEQENEFDVTIKSNSASIIKNLVLKVEYPFGFDFISSTPSSSSGNTVWILGDVKPEEERHIIIRGKVLGGANEQRIFNFYTGTADPRDPSSIGTVFVTNAVPVALKKPFLGLDLALDNQKSDSFVASAGVPVKGEISFQNNLDVPLHDVVVEVRISGEMINKVTIIGDNAFYDSSRSTVMWDNSTLAELKQLSPRDSGRLQFAFATLPPSLLNNSTFRRQSINLDITVRAKRLNENNVPEEIVSTITRSTKVSSDLTLDPRLVRTIGPFQNSGSIPPMPEQPSTYTVMVTVGNSYNTVKNAVFTATLPAYVKWLGVAYPNSNGVSYNADTRQVTWNLGDIAAGTGFASSPKDFAFQVSFLPSISQLGTTPIIINQPKISGTDSFTGKVIQTLQKSLDIKTERDPTYVFGDDKVGGK